MTQAEAQYWRDTLFRPWIGLSFPRTGTVLRAAWVAPAEGRFHDAYFSFLSEELELAPINGEGPDDAALARPGGWGPLDAYTILLELQHRAPGKGIVHLRAKDFLREEGIKVEPGRVFA